MSDKVIKNTYLFFALSLVNLYFGAIVIFNFVILNSVQQNHLGRFKKLPISRPHPWYSCIRISGICLGIGIFKRLPCDCTVCSWDWKLLLFTVLLFGTWFLSSPESKYHLILVIENMDFSTSAQMYSV